MKEKEPVGKFRCAKCGYLTQREAPPKSCPVCRATTGSFDDIGVDRSQNLSCPRKRASRNVDSRSKIAGMTL